MNNDHNPQSPAGGEAKLREALEDAQRYIVHIGCNETERGLPHPQQLLLDKIDAALSIVSARDGEDDEEVFPPYQSEKRIIRRVATPTITDEQHAGGVFKPGCPDCEAYAGGEDDPAIVLLLKACKQWNVDAPRGADLLAPFDEHAMPWLVALTAIRDALAAAPVATKRLREALLEQCKDVEFGAEHLPEPMSTEVFQFIALARQVIALADSAPVGNGRAALKDAWQRHCDAMQHALTKSRIAALEEVSVVGGTVGQARAATVMAEEIDRIATALRASSGRVEKEVG